MMTGKTFLFFWRADDETIHHATNTRSSAVLEGGSKRGFISTSTCMVYLFSSVVIYNSPLPAPSDTAEEHEQLELFDTMVYLLSDSPPRGDTSY